MQEPQDRVETQEQHRLRLFPGGWVSQPRFAEFEIGAAVFVPGKRIENPRRLGEAVFVDRLRRIAGDAREAAQEPAVLKGRAAVYRQSRGKILAGKVFEVHEDKPRGVPELVREIPARLEPLRERGPTGQGEILRALRPLRAEGLLALRALDLWQHPVLHGLLDPRLAMRALEFDRHPHVLRLGGHAHHPKPQGVGTERVDHVERVDAVALALAHRLAVAVEDFRVDGDICEGNLPCIKKPHDHHPRDPERDDVTAGDERGRGIEAVELRRLRRPAERGVRPER